MLIGESAGNVIKIDCKDDKYKYIEKHVLQSEQQFNVHQAQFKSGKTLASGVYRYEGNGYVRWYPNVEIAKKKSDYEDKSNGKNNCSQYINLGKILNVLRILRSKKRRKN